MKITCKWYLVQGAGWWMGVGSPLKHNMASNNSPDYKSVPFLFDNSPPVALKWKKLIINTVARICEISFHSVIIKPRPKTSFSYCMYVQSCYQSCSMETCSVSLWWAKPLPTCLVQTARLSSSILRTMISMQRRCTPSWSLLSLVKVLLTMHHTR